MEWDEPQHWQIGREVRLSIATLELDTGLLPILPRPARDEIEWQRWFGSQFQNQTQEADSGFLPIVTLLAYDGNDWPRRFEWPFAPQTAEQDLPSAPPAAPSAFDDGEGSRDFTEKRFWLESDILLGVPFTPSTAWIDDAAQPFAAFTGSLAAMLVLDDFVNAPSGRGNFGSAPRGRSVRFGFSISAFR